MSQPIRHFASIVSQQYVGALMRLCLDDSGSNDYTKTPTVAVAGAILPLERWDTLAEAWQPFDHEIKKRDPKHQAGGFHATRLVTSRRFSQDDKAAYFHKLMDLLLDGSPPPIILGAIESAFPYGFLKRRDADRDKNRQETQSGRTPLRRCDVRRGPRSTIVRGHEDPYYVALQVSWAIAATQEWPPNEKLHVVVALKSEPGDKSGGGRTRKLYRRFYRRHHDRFFSGITTDVGTNLSVPLKVADGIAYLLGWYFRPRMPGPNDDLRDALLRPLAKRLLKASPVVEFMGMRVDVASVLAAFED